VSETEEEMRRKTIKPFLNNKYKKGERKAEMTKIFWTRDIDKIGRRWLDWKIAGLGISEIVCATKINYSIRYEMLRHPMFDPLSIHKNDKAI
jgi:hypothetical protein